MNAESRTRLMATSVEMGDITPSKLYLLDRQDGSLHVLIYLYHYGPSAKTTISSQLRHRHETVSKSLTLLCRFGFVASRNEAKFPYRQVFELTPLGERLVDTPIHGWPSMLGETVRVTRPR